MCKDTTIHYRSCGHDAKPTTMRHHVDAVLPHNTFVQYCKRVRAARALRGYGDMCAVRQRLTQLKDGPCPSCATQRLEETRKSALRRQFERRDQYVRKAVGSPSSSSREAQREARREAEFAYERALRLQFEISADQARARARSYEGGGGDGDGEVEGRGRMKMVTVGRGAAVPGRSCLKKVSFAGR
jgi:hypothetical protein